MSDFKKLMKEGDLVDNFFLDKKIESIHELIQVLKTEKSIFCRHRLYPCSFIYHQTLATLEADIKQNWFFTVIPINLEEYSFYLKYKVKSVNQMLKRASQNLIYRGDLEEACVMLSDFRMITHLNKLYYESNLSTQKQKD